MDWRRLSMKRFLSIIMILSLIGFGLSLLVHITSLLGFEIPPNIKCWLLHIGIFVVWLPTILVANNMSKEYKRRDFWKAILRGCPRRMRNIGIGIFAYAILNFILFIISNPGGSSNNGIDGYMPLLILRGFSGHWMAFYYISFAVLYSAIYLSENIRRCPNGHKVSPSASYCERCGKQIIAD
jgi:hypothetical protein